ncbi:MAG: extracellular solute-binding protein [Oscillospiraceae bacterium]
MKTCKKTLAMLLALTAALSVVGCGDKDDGSAAETSHVDLVSVNSLNLSNESGTDSGSLTQTMSKIPDGQGEIEWLSYFDLNPVGTEEKSTQLSLFEQLGGSIKYTRCASMSKYDALAKREISGDVPDIFWHEGMTFPANVIDGMFQSIDPIVDFDTPLWADVKNAASQYVLNGKHYVAPIAFNQLSVICYDKARMNDAGLKDPYDLYKKNEWTWDTMEDMMRTYVEAATGDQVRYGVNGWFHAFIFRSTGETLIKYDADKQEYVNNMDSPQLQRAANWLYDLSSDGLVNLTWYDEARKAFDDNTLFYAMGPWASTGIHTPTGDEEYGVVPMPRDPQSDTYYTSLETNAYMWVKGSTKTAAVKTWMECAKLANTQEDYIATGKEKFFVNNPGWTEDMWNLVYGPEARSNFTIVVDPGYGITTALSNNDAATNDTKEALIPYLYSSVSKKDENETQMTWTGLRTAYAGTVDSELATFNAKLKDFIAKGE